MTSETRTYKRKQLPFRQIGPHCLIVHGRNSMTLKSNEVGGFIWQALEEERDVAGVVKELQKEYPDVDEAVMTQDVEEFINELLETTAIDVIKGEPFNKKPKIRQLENLNDIHPEFKKAQES